MVSGWIWKLSSKCKMHQCWTKMLLQTNQTLLKTWSPIIAGILSRSCQPEFCQWLQWQQAWGFYRQKETLKIDTTENRTAVSLSEAFLLAVWVCIQGGGGRKWRLLQPLLTGGGMSWQLARKMLRRRHLPCHSPTPALYNWAGSHLPPPLNSSVGEEVSIPARSLKEQAVGDHLPIQ